MLLDHAPDQDHRTDLDRTDLDLTGPGPDGSGSTPVGSAPGASTLVGPVTGGEDAGRDLARLRLVCLVRSGDGYLIRAAGQWAADRRRAHLDIQFSAGPDGRRGGELENAVRHIQRWCDEGTAVALVDSGSRLTLQADDGTAVVLPRQR